MRGHIIMEVIGMDTDTRIRMQASSSACRLVQ